MSETSSASGADTAPPSEPNSMPAARGVLMRKSPDRGVPAAPGGGRPPAVAVAPPRTIDYVAVALLTMVVGNIARGVLLLGSTPTLDKFVIHANATAKKPDKNFDVAAAVHTLRVGGLIQAAVFGVALLLLAWAMRRSRSASGTRWAVLIIFVYTAMPLYVIPTKGLPAAVQVAGVVIGLASIATILLIFVPRQSQQYFRACRAANRPPDVAGRPRPGLGSLFGPKRPRGTTAARGTGGGLFGGARTTSRATQSAPRAETTPRPTSAKSKAKVRSDSEAIAKGAELARSRAKASKSRRTVD